MDTGPNDGERLMEMLDDLDDLDDLADQFEQSAADGTSVRTVVGTDPVAFVEDFTSNYGLGSWLGGEQQRLVDAIDQATATPGGTGRS